MINLKTLILSGVILTGSLAFTSCNKQSDQETSTVQMKEVEIDASFEEDFAEELTNLKEGEYLAVFKQDELFIPYKGNIGDPAEPQGPIIANKEFEPTFGGIRKAVKYAKGILDAGGCIKAWIGDNGNINIEEIGC